MDQLPLIQTSTNVVKLQAVVERSWEKALERLAAQPDPAHEQASHLLTLFRMGYHLCRVECPDQLMQAILDDALTVLKAQRASIVLVDEVSGKLSVQRTARALQAPRFRKWFSRTLAHRCFDTGQSILCQDASSEVGQDSDHSTVQQNMSSIICALLRTPRKKLGVLHLDRGPHQPAFTLGDFSLADAIAASVSAGIETAQLLVQQASLFLHTVTALARAVEIRDRYTGSHTQRVTDYALLLADQLRLPAAERRVIQIGTPLHDIGKIGIADHILQKPGKLTDAEFDEMKTHAEVGASLLATIPGLRPMLPIIRHHHERWDGGGYPDRLHGERIPLPARIVAVADAFDAMTSDRPYRRAMSLERAFAQLAAGEGSHFDPRCVQAFVHLRLRVEARASSN
jgi:HD-GYP domain-containing protein (c-di-GMP phosphodiesterase class II)